MRKKSLKVKLGVVMGLLAILGGCQQTDQASEGNGKAEGYGGEVSVQLKVVSEKIVDVVITGDNETPDVGGKAIKTLTEEIKDSGKPTVDSVTGATATSKAVISVTQEAYEQALGHTKEAAGKIKMKAGTYTGEGIGFAVSEPIKVNVTVSDEKIEAIEVDKENTETQPIVQSVIDLMIPRMIESQSLSVDSITGATGSSNGVKEAISDALEQALKAAGTDTSALVAFEKKVEKESKEQQIINTKVIVVGMGGSGTSAAMRVAEVMAEKNPKDVQVLAIDKAGKYGGTAANTQEMMGINPPKFQKEHNNGENYVDKEAMKKAWLAHTDQDEKEYFVDMMLNQSGTVIDWLVYDHNYGLSEPQKGFTDEDVYLCKYQYLPNDTAGNKDVIGTYYDKMYADYTKLGGEYMLETEVEALIYSKEKNVITGVKARGVDGTEYTINAKSVVLASGGFAANTEMEKEYFSDDYYPLKGEWKLFGMQQNDGKMIEEALKIGAGTYNIGMAPMVHMAATPSLLTGFKVNEVVGEKVFFTDRQAVWSAADLPMTLVTAPDMLLVDQSGERFSNEADMFYWWKAGPKYYSIISDERLKKIESVGLDYGAAGAGSVYLGYQSAIPIQTPLTETTEVIEAGEKAGFIHKGSTLKELANKIGIEEKIFEKTVADYNSYCDTGEDIEFDKPKEFLKKNKGQTYYAIEGNSYAFSTCGALDINENFNVLLDDKKTPIEGLYAVGNDSMGVLFSEKKDYVTFGGAAQGWAYTSGYYGGELAVEFALKE